MRKVLLLVAMAALSAAQLLACAAVDKNGKKCTRTPCSGSRYCWLHGGTAAAQAAGTTNAVKKAQCKAKTKSGAQCRKSPKAGSEYCAQHAKELDKQDKTAADKGSEEKKRARKVEALTSASPKAR